MHSCSCRMGLETDRVRRDRMRPGVRAGSALCARPRPGGRRLGDGSRQGRLATAASMTNRELLARAPAAAASGVDLEARLQHLPRRSDLTAVGHWQLLSCAQACNSLGGQLQVPRVAAPRRRGPAAATCFRSAPSRGPDGAAPWCPQAGARGSRPKGSFGGRRSLKKNAARALEVGPRIDWGERAPESRGGGLRALNARLRVEAGP
jgi:hypothetical protein